MLHPEPVEVRFDVAGLYCGGSGVGHAGWSVTSKTGAGASSSPRTRMQFTRVSMPSASGATTRAARARRRGWAPSRGARRHRRGRRAARGPSRCSSRPVPEPAGPAPAVSGGLEAGTAASSSRGRAPAGFERSAEVTGPSHSPRAKPATRPTAPPTRVQANSSEAEGRRACAWLTLTRLIDARLT